MEIKKTEKSTRRIPKPFIHLISPESKKEFKAKWKGDSRTISRRVATFSYPDMDGEAAFDMGSDSVKYPITMYFDGDNFEDVVDDFMETCRNEHGRWGITHPVKGIVALQLQEAREIIDPVKNASGVIIETQWIEPLEPNSLTLYKDLFKDKYKVEFEHEALTKYKNANLKDKLALTKAIDKLSGRIDKFLAPLAEMNAEVRGRMLEVQRSLQNLIHSGLTNPLALASNILLTTQIPMLAIMDLTKRLAHNVAFAHSILDYLKTSYTFNPKKGLEDAYINELALSGVELNIAYIAYTGDVPNKSAAIQYVDNMYKLSYGIKAGKEHVQTKTDGKYISGGKGQDVSDKMTHNASKFILSKAYSAVVAKDIVLTKPTTPIAACMQYYNDENKIDYFIESNTLTGDDLILLPEGRVISIYV